MGDTFHCGDNTALVGYLYDDGDAGERAAIAAHLAICSSCAAEVAELSATRQQLSAWTPPETPLDFRLTSGAAAPPARWWSNPLPAWAQLAAAAVIFAFGLALGTVVTRSSELAAVSPQANDSAISSAELARLDQRVRQIEHKSMTAVPVAMDDASRQAMAAWVREEIRESENRNLNLLAQTIININRDRRPEVIEAAAPMGFVPAEIGGARFGQRREE
jgi:anti-sigma factor RsiW